ncbi:MAG: hypothetical protein AAF533_00020 [Acidobacteriota bacterium]
MTAATLTPVREMLLSAQHLLADGELLAATALIAEAAPRVDEVPPDEREACLAMVGALIEEMRRARDRIAEERDRLSAQREAHDAYVTTKKG